MRIFGQILDSDGLSIPYANITLFVNGKKSNFGIISDLDGEFSISDISINPESDFTISYTGFKNQIFKAKDLQGTKIKLIEDNILLEEVIIKNTFKKKINNNIVQKENVVVKSNKIKFVQHLQKHKFAYAGIGGLAGILLIVKAFKK